MIGDPQVQRWHRTLLVGSIGVISLAAWILLWRNGAVLHGPVHVHHPGAGSVFPLLYVGSWTIMTIAMMLPTSVPLVTTFHTIAGTRRDRPLLIALVVLGYLSIWSAVGLVFYIGGVLFQRTAASSTYLGAHTWLPDGAILLVAGFYQFTPLKYRCLDKCRSPLSFVLGHWQGQHDRRNALRLGAHHGLFCVGCCWALMLLMFVVGVGSVAWMLLLGAIMAVEKNVAWGRRISAPLGVLLVAGGLGMLVLT
jgi:predicted metal-binding membrane protein